jgi:hypothetical protein
MIEWICQLRWNDHGTGLFEVIFSDIRKWLEKASFSKLLILLIIKTLPK